MKCRRASVSAWLLLAVAVAAGCHLRPRQGSLDGGSDGSAFKGALPGYVSRACGFDLDDDGVIGEPVDDCRVCDGRTTDPDGDGVDESLLYVDCSDGVDDESCGAPDRPCRTVTWAWTERAMAVGEADAEDIICFRGVCSPEVLTPSVGGVFPAPDNARRDDEDVRGWREVPSTGRQARPFRVATDPTMLVGWDSDGDGSYPPHDDDDLAVLDGGGDPALVGDGLSRAFRLGAPNRGLEMAHFVVRDYGADTDVEQSGFIHFGRRGDDALELVHLHDLSLRGINREQPTQGHRIVFNFFTGGTRVHHLAFVNLEVLDASGFMVRGSGPDLPGLGIDGRDDGPLRFERLTVTADGCDHSSEACRRGGGSAFVGWKLWGYVDGVEILDSSFDAQLGDTPAWEPKPDGNGGAVLVNATQCARGFTVRGNQIRDFKIAFEAQGGDGLYCGYDPEHDPPRRWPRPTGGMVFEDNLVVNTYGPWRAGDIPVLLRGGDDVRRTLGDVRIARNLIVSTDGYDACILVDVRQRGGEAPGRVEILDNLCWGSRAEGRAVGLRLGLGARERERFRGDAREIDPALGERVGGQDDVVVRGNVFGGMDADDVALWLDELPERFVSADNLVDPDARFRWLGDRVRSIEDLTAAVGVDLGFAACARSPSTEAATADLDDDRCLEALRRLEPIDALIDESTAW